MKLHTSIKEEKLGFLECPKRRWVFFKTHRVDWALPLVIQMENNQVCSTHGVMASQALWRLGATVAFPLWNSWRSSVAGGRRAGEEGCTRSESIEGHLFLINWSIYTLQIQQVMLKLSKEITVFIEHLLWAQIDLISKSTACCCNSLTMSPAAWVVPEPRTSAPTGTSSFCQSSIYMSFDKPFSGVLCVIPNWLQKFPILYFPRASMVGAVLGLCQAGTEWPQKILHQWAQIAIMQKINKM